MISEEATRRPSASTLVHHPCICPNGSKSKAQLRYELNKEKFKNEMLKMKVKKYEQQICQISPKPQNEQQKQQQQLLLLNQKRQQYKQQTSQISTTSKFARSLSSTFL